MPGSAELSGDRGLWREAVRGVTPLDGQTRLVSSAPAAEPALVAESRGSRPASPPLDRLAGVDRANAERLKRGLHPIEASLDLHGMTQAGAHEALIAFVRSSRDAGRRCVLVITGRGLGPGGPGVLKTAIPRWLEESELRPHILGFAPAQPRHDGTGALYLLLRRRRIAPPS